MNRKGDIKKNMVEMNECVKSLIINQKSVMKMRKYQATEISIYTK